jgi:hypothetical protein
LLGATRAALILAAIVAMMLARRRPDYRPIAWFLAVQTVGNFVRVALATYVFAPTRASVRAAGLDPALVPFTGAARAAFAVETTCFLLWSAGIAAVSVAVFSKRRPWVVGLAWVVVSGVVAFNYPALRGDALRRAYLAADLAGLAVGIGAFVQWVWRVERPRLPHGAVLLIMATDIAALAVGPWRHGDFFSSWPLAQVSLTALYAVLITLEGIAWKRLSSSKPS